MKYCKLIYICKARAGAAENGDEPVKKATERGPENPRGTER